MATVLERPRGGRRAVEPITGTAVIYYRVSGGRQEDGASLDVQREACLRYCEDHGLQVIGEFKDIESGLHADRAEYRKAVELAQARRVDKVVVWRYDRLGRDSSEYIPLLKSLRRIGVDVASITQPTESIFMQQVIGIMAEEESRQLSVRVTASKQRRLKEGKWSAAPPFGYSNEKHSTGGSVLVPNGEAPMVKELFSRYASGNHSLMDLRRYLNDCGVAKGRSGILYILRNRTYLGEVPNGRFSRSEFFPKPEATWVAGAHEPLVDVDTFALVQTRLDGNAHRRGGGVHPKFLFSGLLYCGLCGHKFTGRITPNGHVTQFKCGRKNNFGDCKARSVVESVIRKEVLPPLERLLGQLKQDDVRAMVIETLTSQAESVRAANKLEGAGLAEAQKRLEYRLSALEDRLLDGLIDMERYVVRRDEIKGQLAEIKSQLTAQPHVIQPKLDQLVGLVDALEGMPLDDLEWRHILEGTLDRVLIHPESIEVRWQDWCTPLLEGFI